MHFQVINDDFYDLLILKLRQIVPEFSTTFDDDDIYPILGQFSRFILDNWNNEAIMIKCFNFITIALEEGKYETEDAIVIQIFEVLYEDKVMVEIARKYLKGKAIEIFTKFNNI